MDDKKYTCCICGREFDDWGNNPWPVVKDEDARCCNECNETQVVKARIELVLGLRKEE